MSCNLGGHFGAQLGKNEIAELKDEVTCLKTELKVMSTKLKNVEGNDIEVKRLKEEVTDLVMDERDQVTCTAPEVKFFSDNFQ